MTTNEQSAIIESKKPHDQKGLSELLNEIDELVDMLMQRIGQVRALLTDFERQSVQQHKRLFNGKNS